MHYKMSTAEKIFVFLNYTFLTLLCLIMLYPFINSLAISLSDRLEVQRGKVSLWPLGFNFDSYAYILRSSRFMGGLGVTVFITIVGTAWTVFMTSMFAYPLSRRDFRLKTPITMMVVFTMFFGGGLIPYFLLIRFIGLFDTIWVYIIPSAISPWSLIILRNFFQQIPAELEESAHIDGANDFIIMIRIIMPISLPSIATIALWAMVGYWNTFTSSLYFTSNPNLRTMQIVLRSVLLNEDGASAGGLGSSGDFDRFREMTPQSLQRAWIMATTLPIICVYPFLQKYFVKGVIVGSLKG